MKLEDVLQKYPTLPCNPAHFSKSLKHYETPACVVSRIRKFEAGITDGFPWSA